MKTRSLVAVVFCMSFASLAFANMAFRQVVTYPLVIEVSPDATQPKLIIPRQMLDAMHKEGNPQTVEGTFRVHSVIAGWAIALGLVFGGLWLVRQRPDEQPHSPNHGCREPGAAPRRGRLEYHTLRGN